QSLHSGLPCPGGPVVGPNIDLGMGGSVRLWPPATPVHRHDHVDLLLAPVTGDQQDESMVMRYNDPRRFGSWHLLRAGEEGSHWLLNALGPEPLSTAFDGDYLFRRSRGLRVAVTSVLMIPAVA